MYHRHYYDEESGKFVVAGTAAGVPEIKNSDLISAAVPAVYLEACIA